MKIELYRHGLSSTLNVIEELLADALNTNNKNEKTKNISQAYGMVKAINTLIKEEEAIPCVENNN